MAAPKADERREPIFDAAPSRDDMGPETTPRRVTGKGPKRRRRNKKRARKPWTIGRVAYWGAVAALWLVIAGIGGAAWVGAHLPPIQSLEIPKRPPSIKIVDMQGHLLATRGDMGGEAVPLKDLPRYVPQAFVAIEDRRFYSHYGVDPIGIARAAVTN